MVLLITVTNMKVYPANPSKFTVAIQLIIKGSNWQIKHWQMVFCSLNSSFLMPIFSHLQYYARYRQYRTLVNHLVKLQIHQLRLFLIHTINNICHTVVAVQKCLVIKNFFLVEILFKYNSGQRVIQLHSGIAMH